MDERSNTLSSGISLIIDNLLNDARQSPKVIISVTDTSASSSSSSDEDVANDELEDEHVKVGNSLVNVSAQIKAFNKSAAESDMTGVTNDKPDPRTKEQVRISLASKELQCKQLKLKLTKKKTQMSDMTMNISQLKYELTRKQSKAKRLYQCYTKATQEVNQLCQQINDSMKALKFLEGDVDLEQQEVNTLEQECRVARSQVGNDSIHTAVNRTSSTNPESGAVVVSNNFDATSISLQSIENQLRFLNSLIESREKGRTPLDNEDSNSNSSSDVQPRPMSVCSIDNFTSSPQGSAEDPISAASPSRSVSAEYFDSNRMITPESSLEFELNVCEESKSPTSASNAVASTKPVLSKAKKDTLLRKILLVETKNEICEIAKNKKDQMLRKNLEDQRREQEINQMKTSLKTKQMLNKLLISFKETLQQSQSIFDTVDDQEFHLHCLTYLLNHSKYGNYDHLQIDAAASDPDDFIGRKTKRIKYTCSDLRDDSTTQSVLEHIDAYRISLAKEQTLPKQDSQYLLELINLNRSHCIDPDVSLCLFDLHGTCNDEQCSQQHRSDYMLTEKQRLMDLLLYRPTITRFPDVEITRQNTDTLRNHLNTFVDNLLKKYTICQSIRYIITLIRSSCDNSVLDLTRCVPKQQFFLSNRVRGLQNTFSDLELSIRIQDRDNVLTFGKVKHPTDITLDSIDSNISRYYESEPLSLLSKLEQTLQQNPNDIDGWIRLAYLHLNSADTRKASRRLKLDAALQVLCKALDLNREKSELWCTYLFFFANRLNSKTKNVEQFDKTLHSIVRRVLILCPNFEIWKSYLSLCVNYLDKELLSCELLEEIRSGRLLYFDKHNSRDFRQISASYLEIIFYKVSLYLELGQRSRAETFLGDLMCLDLEDLLDECESSDLNAVSIVNHLFVDQYEDTFTRFNETNVLVRQDKLFAWLCFLHLHCFGVLPQRNFAHLSQSFGPGKTFLICKQPFVIRFKEMKKRDLARLLIIFQQALVDCFLNVESNPDEYVYSKDELICLCLPLFQNLINLSEQFEDFTGAFQVYDILRSQSPSLVTLTVSKALFEASQNLTDQCLSSLCTSSRYKERNIGILFPICLLHYRLKNVHLLNKELAHVVRLFTNALDDIPINIAFHKLLMDKNCRTGPHSEFFQTVNARLWILYLLCELANGSVDRIDSVYRNLVAISMANKEIDELSLFLIHLLYLDSFVSKIHVDADLKLFVERLQFASQQLHSHLLQYRLIKLFSDQLFQQSINRFLFVQQFFSHFWSNVYLLKELVIICAGQRELRARLHSTLKSLITRIGHKQIIPLFHWNLLLYFTLSAKQHLDAHHYFQQAISSYPYNRHLWKQFIDYEQSLEHIQHIDVIQHTLKRLKLPQSF